jgi:hypothetical protein
MTREEKIKYWNSLTYYQMESQINHMIASGNTEDIDAAREILKGKKTVATIIVFLFVLAYAFFQFLKASQYQ